MSKYRIKTTLCTNLFLHTLQCLSLAEHGQQLQTMCFVTWFYFLPCCCLCSPNRS